MIRGVIFDLDGVLVTTDELHYRSWKKLADAEGIPFDREINHRLRGIDRMSSLAVLLERSPRIYTEEQKLSLAARKNADFVALLAELSPKDVLPGAMELLTALRESRIGIAVASSSRNARKIIEQAGLTRLLDAIVDGNDVRQSKPHPEVFLLAAKRLALPPEQCLAVEDAAAGIEAARRAGMTVLGVGKVTKTAGATMWASGLDAVSAESLLFQTAER